MQYTIINNSIITLENTDVSTSGKRFKSRFLQPGLAGYPGQYGNALIRKESLDKFINTLVNKPVIINHKSDIKETDKAGEVLNVWFNADDGWYWCSGVIYDNDEGLKAQNLIKNRGWSVSCSYSYTKSAHGGTENNIPYDIEFLDGEFEHLAIVENPRYERANIVFNAKINNTFEGHAGRKGQVGGSLPRGVNINFASDIEKVIAKAKSGSNENKIAIIGEVQQELIDEAKENNLNLEGYKHNIDVYSIKHSLNNHGNKDIEEPRGQIAITENDIKQVQNIVYSYDKAEFGGKNKQNKDVIKLYKQMPDGYLLYIEEVRTGRHTLTLNTMRKYKNKIGNSNTLTGATRHVWSDTDANIIPEIVKNETLNVKKNNEVNNAMFDEIFDDIFAEALTELILGDLK